MSRVAFLKKQLNFELSNLKNLSYKTDSEISSALSGIKFRVCSFLLKEIDKNGSFLNFQAHFDDFLRVFYSSVGLTYLELEELANKKKAELQLSLPVLNTDEVNPFKSLSGEIDAFLYLLFFTKTSKTTYLNEVGGKQDFQKGNKESDDENKWQTLLQNSCYLFDKKSLLFKFLVTDKNAFENISFSAFSQIAFVIFALESNGLISDYFLNLFAVKNKKDSTQSFFEEKKSKQKQVAYSSNLYLKELFFEEGVEKLNSLYKTYQSKHAIFIEKEDFYFTELCFEKNENTPPNLPNVGEDSFFTDSSKEFLEKLKIETVSVNHLIFLKSLLKQRFNEFEVIGVSAIQAFFQKVFDFKKVSVQEKELQRKEIELEQAVREQNRQAYLEESLLTGNDNLLLFEKEKGGKAQKIEKIFLDKEYSFKELNSFIQRKEKELERYRDSFLIPREKIITFFKSEEDFLFERKVLVVKLLSILLLKEGTEEAFCFIESLWQSIEKAFPALSFKEDIVFLNEIKYNCLEKAQIQCTDIKIQHSGIVEIIKSRQERNRKDNNLFCFLSGKKVRLALNSLFSNSQENNKSLSTLMRDSASLIKPNGFESKKSLFDYLYSFKVNKKPYFLTPLSKLDKSKEDLFSISPCNGSNAKEIDCSKIDSLQKINMPLFVSEEWAKIIKEQLLESALKQRKSRGYNFNQQNIFKKKQGCENLLLKLDFSNTVFVEEKFLIKFEEEMTKIAEGLDIYFVNINPFVKNNFNYF